MFSMATFLIFISLLLPHAFALPVLHPKQTLLKPVITSDFPDPSIIKVNNTWYAFASQSAWDYKSTKVQLATSPDFQTWTLHPAYDALRSLPSWVRASDPAVWAPSVSRRSDGKFLMYFSAVTNTDGSGRYHCVGAALADNVAGPYDSISDVPFACPIEKGGALDASFFMDNDPRGQGKDACYAVYKIDANSKGHGGSCGNGIEPIVKTPIMIQQVGEDGIEKIGEPVELISNDWFDGPLVEAPYMVRNEEGVYVLFFSSNCYLTDLYDVSWATSRDPLGPFVKTSKPLYVTGTQGMIGPGGASVADDGRHFAMHGYASRDMVGKRRSLYVTTIEMTGTLVRAQ